MTGCDCYGGGSESLCVWLGQAGGFECALSDTVMKVTSKAASDAGLGRTCHNVLVLSISLREHTREEHLIQDSLSGC